jgi:hypothetical protein
MKSDEIVINSIVINNIESLSNTYESDFASSMSLISDI